MHVWYFSHFLLCVTLVYYRNQENQGQKKVCAVCAAQPVLTQSL